MSPEERLETRIVRLETRGERWDLTVPLLGEVAVMDERVDGFKEDLNEGLKAIRAEVAEVKADLRELKKDQGTRSRERRAMWFALVLAAIGLIGNWALQLSQARGGR